MALGGGIGIETRDPTLQSFSGSLSGFGAVYDYPRFSLDFRAIFTAPSTGDVTFTNINWITGAGVASVPEPSSGVLLVIGLAGVIGLKLSHKRVK